MRLTLDIIRRELRKPDHPRVREVDEGLWWLRDPRDRIVGADDESWVLPVPTPFVPADAVAAMMRLSAKDEIPIMCFVGNRGCIQIHSGPISQIKPMGPWLNVMDETFHLHLRLDHIREVWAVRKPASEGHVTSLEAYDAAGQLIIQFFGKRKEGAHERDDSRGLVETLPRPPRSSAA